MMKLKLLFSSIVVLAFIGVLQYSGAEDDLIVLGNGHAPIFISNTDNGRFDFDRDNLNDFYVRAHFSGNEKQLYKVTYKLKDDCVTGGTYEDAYMKIGFTNQIIDFRDRFWISDGITAWNPWFKSQKSMDENKQIDLADNFPWGAPNSFFYI